ncbi:TonB-dependent receptor family protein [Sinobacterium norvegicum]|nr:TonB-dependent receptor [Sinobacterium norvegicum]
MRKTHTLCCWMVLATPLSVGASVDRPVNKLETVVVTATRSEQSKRDLSESLTAFEQQEIEFVSPSHPSEMLNRAAGVHINNLGGEGHMTAIRQPISTRGVYLFLEDGLPIRPTGFFNHNALYEVNIPQSGQLEVVKGPGSALYGSDAIGGVINSLTAPPSETASATINAELGSDGWQRGLLSGSTTLGKHGVKLDVNVTANEGFRDDGDYNRQSFTGRWDYNASDDLQIKTLLSYTEVEQSGVSDLTEDDYKNDPSKNYFQGDTAFREVQALRLSSEFSLQLSPHSSVSITPYYRNNTTAMAPSWMVTYDPNERETTFQSLGFLTQYQFDLNDNNNVILGLDVDYTPSSYNEQAVSHQQNGDIYTGYTPLGHTSYDYDANQTSLSPYIHFESQLSEKLLLTAGLRYDYFRVDYDDNLSADAPDSIFIPQLGRPVTHLRPEDQSVSFEHMSPKFGLVYQINGQHDAYFNYRHAFSVPSTGTLFRSGSTENSDQLEPIKADSFELGARGLITEWLYYEAALYHMLINDDLVTVIDGYQRNTYNAGETSHQGVELSLFGDITEELSYALAWTKTKQRYESFSYTCCYPSENVDVSGNTVAKAPETIANISLAYAPMMLPGVQFELEWQHLGEYYTDVTNTASYAGHDLFNLRAAYAVDNHWRLYARLQNLSDERYSTYTSNQVGDDEIHYRPGQPRSFYGGFTYSF